MTRTRLAIRRFRAGDQDAVKRLVNEGLGERFGVVDASFNPDLDDIAAHYVARGHVFVVAALAGAVVGTGCLKLAPDGTTGEVVRVSVRRDRRGQGIGRKLVERLLAEAQRRGLQRVWMETNAGWDSAIRLYEGCGFHRYAHTSGALFLERVLLNRAQGDAGAAR